MEKRNLCKNGRKLLLTSALIVVMVVGRPSKNDAVLSTNGRKPPKAARPNILLIMCDQFCASLLPCYGGTADAPHIERLAARGMVYTSAYCSMPVSSPSRASLITGLYPHRHGIAQNVFRVDYPTLGGPDTEEGIDGRDITTEGLLYDNGYKVYHAGKWHLSGEDLACYPVMYREHQEYGTEMKETFERAISGRARSEWVDWYGWKLPVTMTPAYRAAVETAGMDDAVEFFRKMGRLDLPLEDTYDYRTASKCVQVIQESTQPFMATCSFNLPHDPNVVPSPYYEQVDMSRIKADVTLPCDEYYHNEYYRMITQKAGNDFLTEFLRIYHASIKLIDDQVGRLLEALEERGIADNTLIIFTADHGDYAGGHGMVWKTTSSFYEEVARVPLIICAPDANPGRYEKPVELVDVMPTILEYSGVSVPLHIDGASLLPVLAGGNVPKDVAISERLNWSPDHKRHPHTRDEREHFMVRYEQYKYVFHREGNRMKQLLFDLQNDPHEYTNLFGTKGYEDTGAAMHERLRTRLAETGYELVL